MEIINELILEELLIPPYIGDGVEQTNERLISMADEIRKNGHGQRQSYDEYLMKKALKMNVCLKNTLI